MKKEEIWYRKGLGFFNLEDALEAHNAGFSLICADGKIKFILRDEQ